ncbi:unnamed protein product, partial [Porites evermanni]
MSSDLRAAVVLQGSDVLQSLPSSLPDAVLASRVPSTYSNYNCYKPRSKGLSYSRLRELVLQAFKDVVPGISAIGTHSLRSGGATAAANAGVPHRLFKRHGRWASESAKDE